MLPRCLFLTLLFLLPDFSYSTQVPFVSHSLLDIEQPSNLAGSAQFTPSPSYPLPPTSVVLRSRPITVYKPRSLDILHRTRLRSLQHSESEPEQLVWDLVPVEGPDVGDIHTLAQLARMSGNAYALPGQKNWYEVHQAWNSVSDQYSIAADLLLTFESLELSIWLGGIRRLQRTRFSIIRQFDYCIVD